MSKSKLFYLKQRILKNQSKFIKLEKKILEATDLKDKCEYAYQAATFASAHTTDIFSSEIIENTFLDLSRKYTVQLSENFKKNSILHVMTEAYTSGGHTRCVERFVKNLPQFIHSCVVLKQTTLLPSQLESIMKNSGGSLVIENNNISMLQKAINLRQFASNFEYIVLHTHMNDPVALIAFGTREFKRPIILFNHASHSFWLGVSISDWVADLDSYTNKITQNYRCCINYSLLGIPNDKSNLNFIDKKSARNRLGVSLEKKIIYSGGQFKKYSPIDQISFKDIVQDILNKDRNIIFYVAGIKKEFDFWSFLQDRYPDNLRIFDVLDYEKEYPYYLASADLVIDSYPVGGGTAVIDAVRFGKPVLTLTNYQDDFLLESLGFCGSYESLICKALKILNDKEYACYVYNDILEKFNEKKDIQKWRDDFFKILKSLPKEHNIYSFKRIIPEEITDCSIITSQWTEPIKNIPLLRKIRRYILKIKINKKGMLIKLFGFYLLKKGIYENGDIPKSNIF